MCSTVSLLLSACVLVVLVTSGQCQNNMRLGRCDYLTKAKSRWHPNAGPFKLYTRSRAPRITRGQPVEVTIGPFSRYLSMFNFTSFIMYATPVIRPNMELEFWAGTPQSPEHIGVFQIFDRWAAGAGAMSCNPRSRTEDSVGAYEDLVLPAHYQAPARNQVSVLWWPTKEALAYPEIKFVANLKSGGQWFKVNSTPWKVNRPVDQWAFTERWLARLHSLQRNMRAFERRLDQPGGV